MNRTQFVEAISNKSGLTKKDADAALRAFIETVEEELKKKQKIQLVGFGTFEVKEMPEREGRNPATGEKTLIKASSQPKFKPGKSLKDAIN